MRSSWLSTARKWSFARLARSALVRAAANSSSARLRSLMSSIVVIDRTQPPSSSRTAETVT